MQFSGPNIIFIIFPYLFGKILLLLQSYNIQGNIKSEFPVAVQFYPTQTSDSDREQAGKRRNQQPVF